MGEADETTGDSSVHSLCRDGVRRGEGRACLRLDGVRALDGVGDMRNGSCRSASHGLTIWRNGETMDIDVVLVDANDLD